MNKHHAWPSWRYGPKGESAVFEKEADVPAGWHDHPSKHGKAKSADPEKTVKAAGAKENSSPAKRPGRKPKAAAISKSRRAEKATALDL